MIMYELLLRQLNHYRSETMDKFGHFYILVIGLFCLTFLPFEHLKMQII